MKYTLLQWLACPACHHHDLTLETTKTEVRAITRGHFDPGEGEPVGVNLAKGTQTEVMEGALHCDKCRAVYPIQDGVPRMVTDTGMATPSSAHRWNKFDAAMPEWEETFLDYSAPTKPGDFLGRRVLDAGCGYGRHAFYAARYGAEVVAIDSDPVAVEAAAKNTESLARAHVIQADLYHLPFREEVFDLAYSFGVLHHLDNHHIAMRGLTESLRPGGRLMLWVYGTRKGSTLVLNNALRGVTTGMEPGELHQLSKVIATGLRLIGHTPYRVLGKVPVAAELVRRLPIHEHGRWPMGVVIADVYDRLRIPVKHWFTSDELEAWFSDEGYADVQVTRRVRNNETFRAAGTRR